MKLDLNIYVFVYIWIWLSGFVNINTWFLLNVLRLFEEISFWVFENF